MTRQDQILQNRLKTGRSYFSHIPEGENEDIHAAITHYYKNTKYLLFRLFGSKDGFMHIGLSPTNQYKKNRGYELFQLRVINRYIKKKKVRTILELGCGQGTNLYFLEKWNPHIQFIGIDLCPSGNLSRNRNPHIRIKKGDYHNLSEFKDNSVDMVYAIETLCYSQDVEHVMREIYRILKPNGMCIIFDAYRNKPCFQYTYTENLYMEAIEEGFCLDAFTFINDFNSAVQHVGFSINKAINLKPYAKGYLNNVFLRIQRYMRLGIGLKLFLKFLPSEVISGMLSGYLIRDSIKYNLTIYQLHVLSK